jgi:hypothetical protein
MPAGCQALIGIVFLLAGVALFIKAHHAALAHTIIHSRIRPAYWTPLQAYAIAIFFLGFGAFAVVSPIIQHFFKR